MPPHGGHGGGGGHHGGGGGFHHGGGRPHGGGRGYASWGGPVWGGYPYPASELVVVDDDPVERRLRELEQLERIRRLKRRGFFGLGAVQVVDHRTGMAPAPAESDTIFGVPKLVALVGGIAVVAGAVILLKKKRKSP